jgi:hypothetical protein
VYGLSWFQQDYDKNRYPLLLIFGLLNQLGQSQGLYKNRSSRRL